MSAKLPPPPVLIDVQQRYAIPEVCALLRLSRAYVYKEIRAGRLHTIKDGRRSFCSGAEILRRSGVAA
jgi:excisionase family DNA binding protein